MALQLEQELDKFLNLINETVTSSNSITKLLLRHVISRVGHDKLRTAFITLAESAVDDGDDSGFDELIEKQVKVVVKQRAAVTFDRLYQWAFT